MILADVETTAAALRHAFATEEFAIEAYAKQVLSLPMHKPIFSPPMFPARVIRLAELNVVYADIIGVTDTEMRHRKAFRDCVEELGYAVKSVPKIELPTEVVQVSEPEGQPPNGFRTVWENLVFDRQQEQRAQKVYTYFATLCEEPYKTLFQDTALEESYHYKIFDSMLNGIFAGKPVSFKCPVCGRILEAWPEDGKKIGCAFCGKAFEFRISEGDFALVRI